MTTSWEITVPSSDHPDNLILVKVNGTSFLAESVHMVNRKQDTYTELSTSRVVSPFILEYEMVIRLSASSVNGSSGIYTIREVEEEDVD